MIRIGESDRSEKKGQGLRNEVDFDNPTAGKNFWATRRKFWCSPDFFSAKLLYFTFGNTYWHYRSVNMYTWIGIMYLSKEKVRFLARHGGERHAQGEEWGGREGALSIHVHGPSNNNNFGIPTVPSIKGRGRRVQIAIFWANYSAKNRGETKKRLIGDPISFDRGSLQWISYELLT